MTTREQPASGVVALWRWTDTTPNAPAVARDALQFALAELGYDEEVITDAVLAASEVVANAVEHAVGPYEMRLSHTFGKVICEVEDHDPRIPEVPDISSVACLGPEELHRGGGLDALLEVLSTRGRGLFLIHQLTGGAWGFRASSESTKVAWLALPDLPILAASEISRNAADLGDRRNGG